MNSSLPSASDNNRLPSPKSSSFHRIFLSANGLSSNTLKEWVFDPRMLFGATQKWWGNKGKRPTPHEGLDVYSYRNEDLEMSHIGPGMSYPAIFPGRVISVCSDFLGKSIFLRHDDYSKGHLTLFTAYGHGIPSTAIQPGTIVREDEMIAVVANPPARRGTAPPHLHISTGWIPDNLPGQLTWETLGRSKEVVLFDPLVILDLPFSIESLDDART